MAEIFTLPPEHLRAAAEPVTQDFINLFMDYTATALSPDIFRRWSAIALVGGALERRCWVKVGVNKAYGNMFTMLVARPGVGKYIIEEVHGLWRDVLIPGTEQKAFHVAPSNMTKASMVDELGASLSTFLPKKGPPIESHSLLIAAEEMGVMMPEYDMTYIGVLNKVWNNPPVHDETRRTGMVKKIVIPFPQLNIIAGVQPGWLSAVFPEEAWTTGLTSRMVMIYAADPPDKDIFTETGAEPRLRQLILHRLAQLSQLYGQWDLAAPAVEYIRDWKRSGFSPVPTHSKLDNYVPRRTLHLIKLALVSAICRGGFHHVVDLWDLERAMAWLLEAEDLMPDIFRAMTGKSDHVIIEELHYHLTTLYTVAGKAPIHESRLWDFLKSRVPSERVERIMKTAEMADVIRRQAGTELYIPRPKFIHRGVE